MDTPEGGLARFLRSLVGKGIILILVASALCAGCTAPMKPAGNRGPSTGDPGASLQVVITADPARYSPFMSSTVGIRLSAVNISGVLPPDARILWDTDSGYFLSWGPPDFRVVTLGPRYEGGEEPVYWSFSPEQGEKERRPVHISLQVVLPSTGTVVARNNLTVGWEDSMAVVGESTGDTNTAVRVRP
jgi:hypothetical protein